MVSLLHKRFSDDYTQSPIILKYLNSQRIKYKEKDIQIEGSSSYVSQDIKMPI